MKQTLKTGVLTGLISGVFLFSFFTLGAWLNTKYNWGMQAASIRGVGGLLSIPIQAAGIYLAMQNVKKLAGSLSYWRAIKTGLVVSITIAILIAIFSFIYCQFINPGYAEFMVHDAQKAMMAKGEGQQDIDQDSIKVAKQFTTGMQVMMALVGQFVSGGLISLIIGLFIRTKK
jgi:hypothetical protein